MFQDLDAALKHLLDLDDPGAPADLRDADVSFETPDRDYNPTQATINLFLHSVKENRELRDNAPVIERRNGSFFRQPPPMRIDCTYLVTAWSQRTASAKVEEEHRLLGQALRWLSHFPIIPRDHLADQPYELQAMVAQMPSDANLGQFWSALGIAPRPSFFLTVTIAMQPFDTAEVGPPVQTVLTVLVSATEPQLLGLVKDQEGRLIPGAQIRIIETGQTVMTDEAGRFAIADMALGTYTVVVQANGFQDRRQTVSFQLAPQVHDFILNQQES